jgi:hypothetical protein
MVSEPEQVPEQVPALEQVQGLAQVLELEQVQGLVQVLELEREVLVL